MANYLEAADQIASLADPIINRYKGTRKYIYLMDFDPVEKQEILDALDANIIFWENIKNSLVETINIFSKNYPEDVKTNPMDTADFEADKSLKELYNFQKEMIEELEKQNKEQQEKIAQLTQDNMNLEATNELLKQKDSGDNKLIKVDELEEFYNGEFSDTLISVCQNAKDKCSKESRAYEILDAVIASNEYIGEANRIYNELKSIGEIDSNFTNAKFERLGFEVTRNGHIKVKFHGSDKYMYVISLTPSDAHASANSLRTIRRCLAPLIKF